MIPPPAPASGMPAASKGLIFLLAAACGLIAANLYYAQPLIQLISATLGISPEASGLIVTLTQLGYGFGLLFIVPLGDLIENRKLILCVMAIGITALLAAAFAPNATWFFIASALIGLGSVSVQVIVPYATHMVPAEIRGRTVGAIMSGLMLGIMLARPAASFLTELAGWQSIFIISSGIILVLMILLRLKLPVFKPAANMSYGALLRSMGNLAWHTPILQRRAFYQACLFGAFSLFWTAVPMLLASPVFGLSHNGIALFALAGVAGAVSAPLAGRAADRGWTRPASAGAMLCVAAGFLISLVFTDGTPLALAMLVVAAIVLDFGVSANLVLGQRAIFALGAELRGRLNGVYMATFFLGGAIGSALGGWAFAYGGWMLATWVGLAFPLTALLVWMSEGRS